MKFPQIVAREEWKKQRQALLAEEKALSVARDNIWRLQTDRHAARPLVRRPRLNQVLYQERHQLVARKSHPAPKRKLSLKSFSKLKFVIVRSRPCTRVDDRGRRASVYRMGAEPAQLGATLPQPGYFER
jgi:Bacterial protein of unknown function (DUF899)